MGEDSREGWSIWFKVPWSSPYVRINSCPERNFDCCNTKIVRAFFTNSDKQGIYKCRSCLETCYRKITSKWLDINTIKLKIISPKLFPKLKNLFEKLLMTCIIFPIIFITVRCYWYYLRKVNNDYVMVNYWHTLLV